MFGKRDPVCGVKVSKRTKHKFQYRGKTYYFDSRACMSTFEANPEKFIRSKSGKGILKPPAGDIPKCCHDMQK